MNTDAPVEEKIDYPQIVVLGLVVSLICWVVFYVIGWFIVECLQVRLYNWTTALWVTAIPAVVAGLIISMIEWLKSNGDLKDAQCKAQKTAPTASSVTALEGRKAN